MSKNKKYFEIKQYKKFIEKYEPTIVKVSNQIYGTNYKPQLVNEPTKEDIKKYYDGGITFVKSDYKHKWAKLPVIDVNNEIYKEIYEEPKVRFITKDEKGK